MTLLLIPIYVLIILCFQKSYGAEKIGLQDSLKEGIQLIGGVLILWVGGNEVLKDVEVIKVNTISFGYEVKTNI